MPTKGNVRRRTDAPRGGASSATMTTSKKTGLKSSHPTTSSSALLPQSLIALMFARSTLILDGVAHAFVATVAPPSRPRHPSSYSSYSSSTSIADDRRGIVRRRPSSSTLRTERSAGALSPPGADDDEYDAGGDRPTENIPRTGYSLADRMENVLNAERFVTTLTPLDDIYPSWRRRGGGEANAVLDFQYDESGFPIGYREVVNDGEDEDEDGAAGHLGVARIDTVSTLGDVGEESVRWLISMGGGDDDDTTTTDDDDYDGGIVVESYAMIDLPPYSVGLADEMRQFMDRAAADPEVGRDNDNDDVGNGNGGERKTEAKMKTRTRRRGKLDFILITNRQCIHYDASPGVYVTRKSDMTSWKDAFPGAKVIMYRLDVPRECREGVTQALDGYGPWGYDENAEDGGRFVETGRPLTIVEWDDDTKSRVLTRGELPPDDVDDDRATAEGVGGDVYDGDDGGDSSEYSPEAIRRRESAHHLLAVYTPGHTYGSVTYVFPRRGICCSGYALPLDGSEYRNRYGDDDVIGGDDGDDDRGPLGGVGVGGGPMPPPPWGPRLDHRGYLATSASRQRQMSSALSLIDDYIDRFTVVLPARGDAVFLDRDAETRRRELMESVGLYKRIGDIYARLGIVE